MVQVKVKFTLEQATKAQRGSRGIALLFFLTSALDRVGGQRDAPATLLPGKTQYPLYRRLGGPQGQSGQVWKISLPPGFNPRTIQPIVSRYTDYATQLLVVHVSAINTVSFQQLYTCQPDMK